MCLQGRTAEKNNNNKDNKPSVNEVNQAAAETLRHCCPYDFVTKKKLASLPTDSHQLLWNKKKNTAKISNIGAIYLLWR